MEGGVSEYSVRKAREEDVYAIAGIRVSSWRRTYRGIVPDETLAAMDVGANVNTARVWLAQTTSGSRGPLALALVVEDERGDVRGFAHGGAARPLQSGAAPEPFESEIYALYLTPGYERQGLGGRLLGAAARHLRAHGARSLIIWALERNPNRGFYEALGGVVAYEQILHFGERDVREVGFGWPDLDSLIALLERR